MHLFKQLSIVFVLKIISSAEFIIYAILKLVYGYQATEKGTDLCRFSAFTLVPFCRISLLYISVLATLRYLIVCHKKELRFKTWLIIAIVPILGIFLLFSISFYTKDASPSVSYTYCFAFTQPGIFSKVMLYLATIQVIIPCWISTYCYFCVGWAAYKRLNLMKQEAVNNSDERLLKAIKKEKFNLAIQILFVFAIYNVNYSLNYVTWAMKAAINYKRSILVDTIVVIQVHSTPFINPVVTIIFQPDINNEFKLFWIKVKLKIKKFFN
ncbi:hypothetical protein CONCODRAFT_13309 [Conidiobolus coronatus NRRL 28638]|uniref:G-protein coupled receptors family 1 profile domain-containing protein n=1 Tax=Conidiobolus coronatus (strain ATCC 28846 / CBS 209.66 / NRRL 28638) TaxID=796925 RepID=A0A137NR43_CONC2|nr:hypothetical protein CONCODRAFT_13309 [Conidiobolus coronatus NRRL 28638]|eukprot:KXN65192.1 hypothetical protein CONCODRAFT_13309 [Conidiobolus coronatus NRRL 28638]